MSYLVDNLKSALGYDKVSFNNVPVKGWTPNNIKALVICRDGIVVVHHMPGKLNIVRNLNASMVLEDLQKLSSTHYGKPKLNSVLQTRSLSCLEEIYVDSVFMNYPMVIDLMGYIKELASSVSRLRYFGFIEAECGFSSVSSLYSENSKTVGYTLAKDNNRVGNIKIQYYDAKNSKWYSNYYLRSQYYMLDAEEGALHKHFRNVEKRVEEDLAKEKEANVGNVVTTALNTIFSLDLENMESLSRVFVAYKNVLNFENSLYKSFRDCVDEVLKSYDCVKGFSVDYLTGDYKVLKEFYSKFGVFDTDSQNKLAPKTVKRYLDSGTGFVDAFKFLDDLTYTFTGRLKNSGKSILVNTVLSCCSCEMPVCRLSDKLGVNGKGNSVEWFFSILSDYLGFKV